MKEAMVFMISLIFVAITGLVSSDHGTCRAALYRRELCGYRGISKLKCENRGCCFQPSRVTSIPTCYKKVAEHVVGVCPTAVGGRKPCGYRGINPYHCKLRGCCFESINMPTFNTPRVPACHMPVLLPISPEESTTKVTPPGPVQRGAANAETSTDSSDQGGRILQDDSLTTIMKMFRHVGNWQNATKSCVVGLVNRKDCGYPGITRDTCSSKGCCWDTSNVKPGVSWCYYPLWIFPGQNTSSGDPHSNEAASQILTLSENSTTSNPSYVYKPTTASIMMLPPADSGAMRSSNFTTANVTPLHQGQDIDPPQKDSISTSRTEYATIAATALPVTNSPTKVTYESFNPKHWYSFLQYYSFYKDKLRATNSCSANTNSCCRLRPSSPCCEYERESESSQPGQRIVGGSYAGFLKTSIAYLTTKSYTSQFCGGTIVNRRWIATAAHCLLEYCNGKKNVRDIVIKLGKTEKSNGVKGRHEQQFTASKVVCHPYNCKSGKQPRLNDVALIKLSRPANFNKYVNIAALPAQGERPLKGKDCFVLGWGETRGLGPKNVLKQVRVPSYSNEQCNKPDWRSCMVRACMMCAGELNMDACEGDSGGPLFCLRSDGLYVLHGIYSWGRCGAEEKKPAIYTRFSYYVRWIQGVIRKDRIR